MQTIERPKAKPTIVAERRAEASERRVAAIETAAARDREDAACLARDLTEMRQDRDRWRAQAERLAAALDRLKAPVPTAVPTLAAAAPAASADEDLLYGVPAIAEAFRWRPRQVYHLKDKHGLPTFKMGKIVCANRSDIAAWIKARGAAALSAAQGGR